MIRHVIGRDDVDPATGLVTGAERARHAIIVAGRLADLSGPVDPATHLNLDEPDHLLTTCVVAERLEPGAPVLRDGEVWWSAPVAPTSYARRGRVDLGRQRAEWLAATRAARATRQNNGP